MPREKRTTLKRSHLLPRETGGAGTGKEDGRKRPISIPALEDKIVQRATVELLNAIFEQDFLDCSHGFRPGRSAHDALDEVGRVICLTPTEYVLGVC